ncbi:MAG: GAF domain-containing protein, partial [Roseobacter sp.]
MNLPVRLCREIIRGHWGDVIQDEQSSGGEMRALQQALSDQKARNAAISDILKAINSSKGDIQPVFDSIAERAAALCKAKFCMLWRYDQKLVHYCASYGFTGAFLADYLKSYPARPVNGSVSQGVFDKGDTYRIENAQSDAYFDYKSARHNGYTEMMGVPIMADEGIWGCIVVAWPEGTQSQDNDEDLLKTFAGQANLAIENARLFAETQKALDKQTATSRILHSISKSPTDVLPVLHTIVGTACQLLECDMAIVHLTNGEYYWPAASAGRDGAINTEQVVRAVSQDAVDFTADGLPMFAVEPTLNFPSQAIRAKQLKHIPDWSSIELPVHEKARRASLGVCAGLYVPMVRDAECIGLLSLAKTKEREFSDAEISLACSFRDQAMIALENTRLFLETQEALEYQTATSEVLSVISQSPNKLDPVLDAILKVASRICAPEYAFFAMRDQQDGLYRVATGQNVSPEFDAFLAANPIAPGEGSCIGRTALRGETVYIRNTRKDESYTWKEAAEIGEYLTTLGVPLLKDGLTVGVIVMAHSKPDAFTQKQINLLETFAAQAVIAINNAQLFDEVQARTSEVTEALEYQTATSEVLGVISSSPNEVEPVLEAILDVAVRICKPQYSYIALLNEDDGRYHVKYTSGVHDSYAR